MNPERLEAKRDLIVPYLTWLSKPQSLALPVKLTLLEFFFFLQTESISEHPMVTQLIKFSTINVDHVLMETILPLAAVHPPYYHILAQVFHTAGSLQGPRKTAQEMILLQLHIRTSSIW